jgi:hypothetical protein
MRYQKKTSFHFLTPPILANQAVTIIGAFWFHYRKGTPCIYVLAKEKYDEDIVVHLNGTTGLRVLVFNVSIFHH